MIVILIPALGRPERVAPLFESALEATSVPVRVLYLLSDGDDATLAAAQSAGVDWVVVPFPLAGGDYARKINHGIAVTQEPFILQAADDLRFHRGWDASALELMQREHVGVVGTNDLGNPLVRSGRHATHSLLRRSYVEEQGTIDEPGKALHEGYFHCWVDNELVETALARRAWAAARRSRVEHLHHIWRKGTDDDTYRRGQLRYHEDHALFKERRPLWRQNATTVRRVVA